MCGGKNCVLKPSAVFIRRGNGLKKVIFFFRLRNIRGNFKFRQHWKFFFN